MGGRFDFESAWADQSGPLHERADAGHIVSINRGELWKNDSDSALYPYGSGGQN